MKGLLLLAFFVSVNGFSQTSDAGVTSTASASGDHAFVGTHADGVFSNWLNTGSNATVYNLLGFSNQHAGFGVANGSNIVSPIVWMYTNPRNAFRVRTINYNTDITSGTDLFTVRANGNVGIGTTTPDSKLTVAGHVNIGGTGNARLKTRHIDGKHYSSTAVDNLFLNYGIGKSVYVGSFNSGSPTSNLVVSGNVGIGTVSPETMAHIKAPNGIEGQLKIEGGKNVVTSNGEINSSLLFGSNDGSVNGSGDGLNQIGGKIASVTEYPNGALIGMSFYTFNQSITTQSERLREVMRLDYLGNLGIGTTTPTEKLDVNGNIMIQGYGGSNDSPLGILKFYNNYSSSSSVLAQIQARRGVSSFQKGDLAFYVKDGTNLSESLRIVSSGNVGIGTTTPDSKLTVKGTIHSEEVKVDLSVPGPDYVFKDDYNLTPLEELQQYITTNKHLPNIPSAKEMETNGIDLGEMNMKLLEKIEELTLYTINQQKEIETLKKENAKLQSLSKRFSEMEKILESKL